MFKDLGAKVRVVERTEPHWARNVERPLALGTLVARRRARDVAVCVVDVLTLTFDSCNLAEDLGMGCLAATAYVDGADLAEGGDARKVSPRSG
jgi:hypothetical protein